MRLTSYCLRIVERRPRSGVYLRAEASVASLDMIVVKADLGLPVDDDEVEQLSEFRTMLEAQAIVLACKRRMPRDIERMDACNRECRERLKRKESIAQPSADFHLAVIAATQNQFLLRTANSFYLATRAWRAQVFDDIDEALALANGTRFGLVAGVFTRNFALAHRLARDIDAGQVYINEYFAGGISVPFGGNKSSGFGREKGLEALRSYCKLKSVAARIG